MLSLKSRLLRPYLRRLARPCPHIEATAHQSCGVIAHVQACGAEGIANFVIGEKSEFVQLREVLDAARRSDEIMKSALDYIVLASPVAHAHDLNILVVNYICTGRLVA